MAIDLEKMSRADIDFARKNLPEHLTRDAISCGNASEKSKPQQGRGENKTEANFAAHLESIGTELKKSSSASGVFACSSWPEAPLTCLISPLYGQRRNENHQ